MKVDLKEINYSRFSTAYLAAIAEQGLPIDSKDPDEIRVNEALFDPSNKSGEDDYFEVFIA